jgi:hypothetical protein
MHMQLRRAVRRHLRSARHNFLQEIGLLDPALRNAFSQYVHIRERPVFQLPE